MQSSSSVGSGYITGLFEVSQRLGVSRDELLQHAGVTGQGELLPATRLPMTQVIALFRSAATLTGREDLGLEFGRRVRPGTFNVLGYALMTCKTLGDAIALVPHYRRLVFDMGYSEMRFSTGQADARLSWHVLSAELPYSPVLAESLIASWYSFGRWIAGVDLPLKEVHFLHPRPVNVQVFADFFDCPVFFNSGENALVFSHELLAKPLVQADETLHLAMREQARTAMEAVFQEKDLAHRLRQVLIPLMPKCEATLEHAAAAMHMSPRSLQRRLGLTSLKFQDVLDAVRKDLAKVYLRDASLGALDVALLLGYAEQSSFTRAFKVWLGTTPSAWRRAAG